MRRDDRMGLTFALLVLAVVILSSMCSGCAALELDAGPVLDSGPCEVELIPCPGNPDEAFTCGTCTGLPSCDGWMEWCGEG